MSPDRALLQADLELGLRLEGLLVELASRILNSPTEADLSGELDDAHRRICHLLDVDRSSLWHLGPPGGNSLRLLRIVQPPGLPHPPPDMVAAEHFPYIVERIRGGETVLLSTLDDLPPEATRDRESLRQYGTTATAVLPLIAHGRVFAAMTFAMTRGERSWPEALVRRLELVAQIFASALHRRDLDAALRAVTGQLISAQERERARLAQELHDGLSQQLAVLAVELQLLGMRPPSGVADLRARLDDLSTRTKALSSEVHRLAHGLHPAKLARLGLVAAMSGFCRELAAAETLDVQFSADRVPPLPDAHALSLYRVMQEALWNVVKHSGARHASVLLAGHDGAVQLDVVDDGEGFDPDAVASGASLGLLGMRERVAMHGGRIRWERIPGGGMAVRAELPLREAGA